MKETRTKLWVNIERDSALLYFAQLVEELLFNYTIDSFKLPAHNTNTLIREARKTIEHISNGILREGAYDPIKDELVDIISKDVVFTNLMKTNTEITIKILNTKNLHESARVLDYLNIQLDNTYRNALSTEIQRKIEINEFDDLNRLTKYLLIEILNSGYSIEFVNLLLSRIFKRSVVDGIGQYEKFINTFNGEEKEYQVLFKGSSSFLQFKEFFSDKSVKFIEELTIEQINEPITEYLALPGCIIEVDTKAKDPFKAFNKAKYFFENVVANFMFIQHQGEYAISPTGLIRGDDTYYYYTGANNPILRRPDELKTEKFKLKLNNILKCMNSTVLDDNSKQRISLAYFRHLNSLRSVSYQTQLVDLWSGIEILVPIFSKDSSDKICQICDSLIPIITSEYFYKITYYLYQAVQRSYKRIPIIRILKTVNGNLYLAFLSCIMMRQYEYQYTQIYSILSTYPLLQKRIEYYKNKLNDPKELLRVYKNHQIRVGWQIQRIYRARNLIIHSGKTPYQLDKLVENLHYYFDTVINRINEEASKSEKYTTLEHLFLTYKFHDGNYVKFLEKHKNKEIDEQFIKIMIRKEF